MLVAEKDEVWASSSSFSFSFGVFGIGGFPGHGDYSRDDQEQQGEEVRGLVGAGVNERGVGVVSTVGIVGVLAGSSFGRVMCSRSGFLARGPVV